MKGYSVFNVEQIEGLKVLKDDKRAIFSAAAHAQRAADYLHGLQPVIDEEDSKQGVAA
ncbi:hypothetical protein [Rhodovulum sp. MB263]|uniref:hypothetical protein n=1 Tax=Rhodovulum sp. (strain MB263) TaxID=308754 RepID=UPI001E649335|nr:hypothetical protein [Rhodovulum sp. MB263]